MQFSCKTLLIRGFDLLQTSAFIFRVWSCVTLFTSLMLERRNTKLRGCNFKGSLKWNWLLLNYCRHILWSDYLVLRGHEDKVSYVPFSRTWGWHFNTPLSCSTSAMLILLCRRLWKLRMTISNVVEMLFICLKLNLWSMLSGLGRRILEGWCIFSLLEKLRTGDFRLNPHSLGCCIWRNEVVLLFCLVHLFLLLWCYWRIAFLNLNNYTTLKVIDAIAFGQFKFMQHICLVSLGVIVEVRSV